MANPNKLQPPAAMNAVDDAVAGLFITEATRMARIFRPKIGDFHDTEDLVGDAFVRVIAAARRDGLRVVNPAYLYRTVNNLNKDRSRIIAKTPELIPADEVSIPVEDDLGYDPLDRRVGPARKAFNELTEGQQDVLNLRLVDDLSHEQTGKILGRSQGAVRFAQHYAIQTLRHKLGVKMDSSDS